ncbi:MAG: alpha/beta hydrolase [Pseudomonadota bacterium]
MHPDAPSDPPRRFLSTGTWRLAYTDEGSGSETIVAVPGLPGSVRDFRWLAAALGEGVRFVRIELPGYGESPRTGHLGMTIPERTEIIRTFIEALHLAPATLIGHSSGATLVTHLAHHHPALVKRCVLVSPPGPHPHYPMGAYRVLVRLFRSRIGRAAMRPALRAVFRAFVFPDYLTDRERMYTTLDAAAKDFSLYRDDLGAMTQPTTLAWARDDRLIPVASYEALEAIAPPGTRLHFEDGGHNIQKTRAVELARSILGDRDR